MPQMFSERLRHFFTFLIIFASVSPPKSGGNRPKQKKHQDGLSEDLEKDAENDLQKLHDKYIKQLEALMDDKEKEIMTV